MSHAHIRMVRLGAVVLASSATLGAASGAASGATPSGLSGATAVPTTLAGIRAEASTDITGRVDALNAAIGRVNAVKGLGAGRAALASYLGTDIHRCDSSTRRSKGTARVQQAAHDFGTIFADYRVYRLVLPAARIVDGADRATGTVIPDLAADAAKAQSRVTPANQARSSHPRHLASMAPGCTRGVGPVHPKSRAMNSSIVSPA